MAPVSITALDKTEILDGLFAVWDDITALGGRLTDAQWQTPTELPGWSVHDVLAHLIGIESMLQGVETPDADIDVTTLEHVHNDIGALNERWIRALRGLEPAELLDPVSSSRNSSPAGQGVTCLVCGSRCSISHLKSRPVTRQSISRSSGLPRSAMWFLSNVDPEGERLVAATAQNPSGDHQPPPLALASRCLSTSVTSTTFPPVGSAGARSISSRTRRRSPSVSSSAESIWLMAVSFIAPMGLP